MTLRRPPRLQAYTLVELMITVAVLGILVALAGPAARISELRGLTVLQRERATVLLDYEADCVSTGRTPDPAVVERLTTSVPGAAVTATEAAGATTLTVHWRAPGLQPAGRLDERSVTVFTGSAR